MAAVETRSLGRNAAHGLSLDPSRSNEDDTQHRQHVQETELNHGEVAAGTRPYRFDRKP